MSNDDDDLFLTRIDDLHAKLQAGGHGNLIHAAGLLRGLLIDKETLTSRVNRGRNVKFRFQVCWNESFTEFTRRVAPEILGTPGAYWGTIDPTGLPEHAPARREVNIDQLLQAHCVSINESDYSVRDIIRLAANKLGGVHIDVPDDDQKRLLGLESEFRLNGLAPAVACIQGILRVTLAGLQPLVDAVRASQR